MASLSSYPPPPPQVFPSSSPTRVVAQQTSPSVLTVSSPPSSASGTDNHRVHFTIASASEAGITSTVKPASLLTSKKMDHLNNAASRPPPPAYNRVVNKVTRGKSLRPIVFLCVLLSFIWCAIVGASYIKQMSYSGVSGKLLAAYIIQAALFFALCLLELWGLYTAYSAKIKAGKIYVWCTMIGGTILIAAEVVRLALHFAFKKDVQSACKVQEGEDYPDTSLDEIVSWCNSDWKNDIWRIIAWLIFSIACSGFMFVLARSFYHQLLDPNFGRVQQGNGIAASDRFRLDAMNASQNMPYNGPQDAPFTPPYTAQGDAPSYGGYAAPPMYVAPEKGTPYAGVGMDNDRKDSMVDVNMDLNAAGHREERDNGLHHDRDLVGQTEPLSNRQSRGSTDSDDTIQGRRGEGQV